MPWSSAALLLALAACGVSAPEAPPAADPAGTAQAGTEPPPPEPPPPGAEALGAPQIAPMDEPAELAPDCQAGDGPSCFNLGLLYLEGAEDKGLPQDSALALTHFHRACALGVDRGCTNRDILATRLRGRAGDPETRAAWAAACDAGAGGACVDLGRALQQDGDTAGAAARYRQSCEADPKSSRGRACTDLGVMALRADPPDKAGALALFKKGCAGGDPAGCMNAARALYLGDGVDRDERLARQYLSTACQGGSDAACSRLAALEAGSQAAH